MTSLKCLTISILYTGHKASLAVLFAILSLMTLSILYTGHKAFLAILFAILSLTTISILNTGHKHFVTPWWRHQMETFSALLAFCAGNSSVTGEFPAQRPVTRGFDVFFDLRLNKWLRKQSWGWWFETPSHPLWRHCNAWLYLSFTQDIRRSLLSSMWSQHRTIPLHWPSLRYWAEAQGGSTSPGWTPYNRHYTPLRRVKVLWKKVRSGDRANKYMYHCHGQAMERL